MIMKPNEIVVKYIGQKEGKNNTFDNSTELGRLLIEAGQLAGEAWCCLFMEGIHKEAYPERFEEIDNIFTKGAVSTFENLKKEFPVLTYPKVNAMAFWQKYVEGKASWQGHTGLVTRVNADDSFESVEGNTNEAGSREGTTVMAKPHRMNWDTMSGLRLIGFIEI